MTGNPPSMWGLPSPQTSAFPAQDACTVCQRFDRAIRAAEEQKELAGAAKYREAKTRHEEQPHRKVQQ
ncbi:hypothetical protein ACFZB6_08500 [Streptomyces syringium]|uniref:hypothetical protein n=1 Tax=Streptomyces syringium TaxID=76729 RepID=UPI0033F44B67